MKSVSMLEMIKDQESRYSRELPMMTEESVTGWKALKDVIESSPKNLHNMIGTSLCGLLLATSKPNNTHEISLQTARAKASLVVLESHVLGKPVVAMISDESAKDAEAFAEVLAEDASRLAGEAQAKLKRLEVDNVQLASKVDALTKQLSAVDIQLTEARNRINELMGELASKPVVPAAPLDQAGVMDAVKAAIREELKCAVEVARKNCVQVFYKGLRDLMDLRLQVNDDMIEVVGYVENHPAVKPAAETDKTLAMQLRMLRRGIKNCV